MTVGRLTISLDMCEIAIADNKKTTRSKHFDAI